MLSSDYPIVLSFTHYCSGPVIGTPFYFRSIIIIVELLFQSHIILLTCVILKSIHVFAFLSLDL